MLGLVPLGSAPIGTLSLDTTIRPLRDITTTGWKSGAVGAIEGGGIVFDKTEDFSTAYATTHSRTISAPGPLQTLVFFINNNTFPGITISNLTDTGGGTWILDAVYMDPTFGFYRRVGGSTTGNITISWTSSNLLAPLCRTFYLTGASQTLTVDSTTNGSFGYTSAVAAAITTNSNNALILAAINRGGGGTSYVVTPTSAGTERLNVINDGTLLQFLLQRNAGTAGSKTLTGTWTPSGGYVTIIAYRPVELSAVLAETADEAVADNSDYFYSGNLYSSQQPVVFELSQALAAGTYSFKFKATKDMLVGQVRAVLLAENDDIAGTSPWVVLSDDAYDLYSLEITTTLSSVRVRLEVRGDSYLSLDFVNSDYVDPRMSTAIDINSHYHDENGMLRKNDFNRYPVSEQFDSYGSATNATIVANQIYAPSNYLSADLLKEDTTTGTHFYTSTYNNYTSYANNNYTYSIYLRSAGRSVCSLSTTTNVTHSAVFDLATSTISQSTNLITSKIESVGNSWYRCSITWKTGIDSNTRLVVGLQTTTTISSYTGNGTSGVYLWGLQYEPGLFANTYRKTQISYSFLPRIEYDLTKYEIVGPEIVSNPGLASGITGWINNAGGTHSVTVVGDEVIITNTSGTGTYTAFSRSFYPLTPGRRYLVAVTGRKISNTNMFIRCSNNTGSFGSFSTSTGTSIGFITIPPTAGIGINLELYSDSSAGGQVAWKSVSIREIRHLKKGLIAEPYTGNIIRQSNVFTDVSYWTANNQTVALSSSKMSPTYSFNAYSVTADATANPHSIQQTVDYVVTPQIFSIYTTGQVQLRTDDTVGGDYVNFITSAPYNSYISGKSTNSVGEVQYIGNGWFRVSMKFTPTIAGSYPIYINRITGDGAAKNQSFLNSGYQQHYFGAQLEHVDPSSTKPTGYIESATQPGPGGRAHDPVGIINDISSFYTGTPFTIYIEYDDINDSSNAELMCFATADSTNSMGIVVSNYTTAAITCGSAYVTTTVTAHAINKIAAVFEPGNYRICANGGVISTSTNSSVLQPNMTRMLFTGVGRFGIGSILGYTRVVRYYPRVLSDGELIGLTGQDTNQNAATAVLTASF